MTRTLRKILAECALFGSVVGVFAAGGGAVGYELERMRKANYERGAERQGHHDMKYIMGRSAVYGGAVVGGAVGAALFLFGDRKKREDETGADGGGPRENDWDKE